MLSIIAGVHLFVAVMLIFLVLIQDSKGAMGGMLGGGGSNTLFGATGATSFIVKITRAVAIIFAGTCIALTILSSNQSTSVIDDYVPTAKKDSAVDTANKATSDKADKPAKKK
ncbi:preprotein translocase subunit SecG [Candidatus Kaiserbacteria bacterium]|nr:MAG: preprotein translocase subunit SecG [Candidatus Kaiserbacteria bacterium]